MCLPRGLSSNDLEKLDQIVARTQPIHKGDVLFHAGDKFSGIFAVRTGCIKLATSTEQGDEQIIGFYFPGEIIGLDGIENDLHTCTAVALDTSCLCFIGFQHLSDVCTEVPALSEQMFRLMGRELSHEHNLLLTITKKHADGRIATFLLSLSSRFKILGYSEVEFRLPMSRSEIGNYLGLTFETVSRCLSKFQKQGLIEINHKYITILDIDALNAVCNETTPAENLRKSAS